MDPDIEVAHITPHHAGMLVGRDLHQQQPVWRIGFQSFRRLRIPLRAVAEVEPLADQRAFGLHVAALNLKRMPTEAVIMTIRSDFNRFAAFEFHFVPSPRSSLLLTSAHSVCMSPP